MGTVMGNNILTKFCDNCQGTGVLNAGYDHTGSRVYDDCEICDSKGKIEIEIPSHIIAFQNLEKVKEKLNSIGLVSINNVDDYNRFLDFFEGFKFAMNIGVGLDEY